MVHPGSLFGLHFDAITHVQPAFAKDTEFTNLVSSQVVEQLDVSRQANSIRNVRIHPITCTHLLPT